VCLITLEWLDHKQTFKPKQVFDNETFELMKDLQILASELRNDINNFTYWLKFRAIPCISFRNSLAKI
jgi:hypothetical protein